MQIERYEPFVPTGLEVFEERLAVRRIDRYRAEALAFCAPGRKWLALQRDADDPLSIRIIGCRTRWLCNIDRPLGYVEPRIASRLICGGWWGTIFPQLACTYVSEFEFVDVLYRILGPIGLKTHYQSQEDQAQEAARATHMIARGQTPIAAW
ncbi:MAG: hypothetical protein ACREVE_02925 [Gammaproteobacteria bacterium]